jgi:lysophospholipase L1-like esterase
VTAKPSIGEQAQALAQFLRETRLPKDPIVVYGSSTVRLWPDIARSLGRNDAVAVGFGGATLRDCVAYYDLLVRPLAPRFLVIAAGANDIEKYDASAETILATIVELIGTARRAQPQLPVAVLTMKPAPFHGPRMAALRAANALLEKRLPEIPDVRLIDIFAPFLNAQGAADPRFYAEDRRHLNDAGYAAWSEAIAASLPPAR